MKAQNWIRDVMAAADERLSALKAEHPDAWDHGRKVGEKDRKRREANPTAYGDDTNAPSHLTGRAAEAWYAGWNDAQGL